MRYATSKLDEFVNKQLNCLFLSGPAGVGKTTLVRQRFRTLRDVSVSWIEAARARPRTSCLRQLLEDVGPGQVEGSSTELRNILEVFLRHQAGNGRFSFIVADGLERLLGRRAARARGACADAAAQSADRATSSC